MAWKGLFQHLEVLLMDNYHKFKCVLMLFKLKSVKYISHPIMFPLLGILWPQMQVQL
jgi:hypothetical protein